jgi:hypothetical protein
MTSFHPHDDEAVQQATERLVENRLRLARQDEVMAIYEDLLRTIWDRIVPTLGRVTVSAILDRSISTTAEHYPFLKHLAVTREGLSFQTLREHLGDQEQQALREAMKELVANLIDLLAVLTGDILVRRLLSEVEGGK